MCRSMLADALGLRQSALQNTFLSVVQVFFSSNSYHNVVMRQTQQMKVSGTLSSRCAITMCLLIVRDVLRWDPECARMWVLRENV